MSYLACFLLYTAVAAFVGWDWRRAASRAPRRPHRRLGPMPALTATGTRSTS
jgi:hypothetical protein